jgi:hypothetical protein
MEGDARAWQSGISACGRPVSAADAGGAEKIDLPRLPKRGYDRPDPRRALRVPARIEGPLGCSKL